MVAAGVASPSPTTSGHPPRWRPWSTKPGRPARRSDASRPRRSGVATPVSSSTRTAIRGRSRTTLAGICSTTGASGSGDDGHRPWRRSERPPAVDDSATRVLVGQPRPRRHLVDARLAVVADAGRERLLQPLPLVGGERDRIVALAQRLQLALQHVVGQRLVRAETWGAVRRDGLVADPGRQSLPAAVGAAVREGGLLVLDDLPRQWDVAVVGVAPGEPLVHRQH